MADILMDFPIWAPPEAVFEGISSPTGLDAWWSLESSGSPEEGSTYTLGFGSGTVWKGFVTKCVPQAEIEWEMRECDPDWLGTRVGFHLAATDRGTKVQFHHTGWPEANAHFSSSCYCWPMYLRLLKRFVESGEFVDYAVRLEA